MQAHDLVLLSIKLKSKSNNNKIYMYFFSLKKIVTLNPIFDLYGVYNFAWFKNVKKQMIITFFETSYIIYVSVPIRLFY